MRSKNTRRGGRKREDRHADEQQQRENKRRREDKEDDAAATTITTADIVREVTNAANGRQLRVVVCRSPEELWRALARGEPAMNSLLLVLGSKAAPMAAARLGPAHIRALIQGDDTDGDDPMDAELMALHDAMVADGVDVAIVAPLGRPFMPKPDALRSRAHDLPGLRSELGAWMVQGIHKQRRLCDKLQRIQSALLCHDEDADVSVSLWLDERPILPLRSSRQQRQHHLLLASGLRALRGLALRDDCSAFAEFDVLRRAAEDEDAAFLVRSDGWVLPYDEGVGDADVRLFASRERHDRASRCDRCDEPLDDGRSDEALVCLGCTAPCCAGCTIEATAAAAAPPEDASIVECCKRTCPSCKLTTMRPFLFRAAA